MSIKDLIRAEIERLREEAVMASFGSDTDWLRSRVATCVDILAFCDTLPEQPVEGLEEAFEKEFAKFSNDPNAGDYALPIDLSDYKDFACHFAEWGAKHARKEGEK